MLDLGCCMGQDLRRLAAEGAPTDNMYGADVEPAFWDLGFELFGDADKFQAHFLHADIFDGNSPLKSLRGRVDVVYVGSVLHLWDWEGQLQALKAIIKLTKTNSLIVGCQIGRTKGHEVVTGWKNATKTMFLHDPVTMEELWRQAAEGTATEWEVQVRIVDIKLLLPESRDTVWMSEDARGLLFEATRKQ